MSTSFSDPSKGSKHRKTQKERKNKHTMAYTQFSVSYRKVRDFGIIQTKNGTKFTLVVIRSTIHLDVFNLRNLHTYTHRSDDLDSTA